jgi:hypothetical protein
VRDGVPLTSSIVAGWLAAADTPRGRLARALMAGQDVTEPVRLVVPTLVLALFSADVAGDARDAERGSATPWALAVSAPGPSAAQGGLCTRAERFINDVIGSVFRELHATEPRDAAGRVIVGIWNWLVSRGEEFARTIVTTLKAAIVSGIRLVAGTLATLAQAVSTLVPHSLVVVAIPVGEVAIPADPAPPHRGSFLAIVSAGGLPDWPDVLKDCALSAGVSLPPFRPAGDPVEWGPLVGGEGLVFVDSADRVLDERGAAALRFHTATELPEVAAGEAHTTVVSVEARVQRADAQKLLAKLTDDLFGEVPSIVRPLVSRALRPLLDGLIERVGRIVSTSGRGSLAVTYHTPREAPPSVDPRGAGWSIAWTNQGGKLLEFWTCGELDGEWHVYWYPPVPTRGPRTETFVMRNGRAEFTVRQPLEVRGRAMIRFVLEVAIRDGHPALRVSGRGSGEVYLFEEQPPTRVRIEPELVTGNGFTPLVPGRHAACPG